MTAPKIPVGFLGVPDSFTTEAAAVAPATGPQANASWLDYQHPDYQRMLPRWTIVKDFYQGEVADGDARARKYLIKRTQGENDDAFSERVKISDFTPHLGTLVDTLAGMLYAVEDRATRVWTNEQGTGGLGDPMKPDSAAHRLVVDADGNGCGWQTVWRQSAIDLITYQRIWVLVDTIGKDPVVKLIPPDMVPNWVPGPTGPVEVLMKESSDPRRSLNQEPGTTERFIKWTLDGWERWEKTKDGEPRKLEGPGSSGPYKYLNRRGLPTLPIFPVRLPMRRYVSWLLARKAQALFNLESVRDMGLRTTSFAKLVLGITSGDQLAKLEDRLTRGSNVLPEDTFSGAAGGHRYIAPEIGPITNAGEVLDTKVEHFWVSGFKMYADAARERTATEVRQDVAAGVGAFLTLLKSAVDDAENGALYRIEQALRVDSPETWGVARVERTEDFASVDLAAVLDQMRDRYLGSGRAVPVGRSALVKLAKESAQYDGLPVNDAEIESAVDTAMLRDLLSTFNGLGTLPALAKARLTMRALASLGIIDPKEEIDLADGSKANLLATLSQQAESLAMADEEAKRRMAELPTLA